MSDDMHDVTPATDAEIARRMELATDLSVTHENETLREVARQDIRILARLAAAESERDALRAKLTPTPSDRRCAENVSLAWRMPSKTHLESSAEWDAGVEVIAAHVASRTAALEKRLAEAVGYLKAFIDLCSESRGVNGFHLNGNIAFWDEFEFVDQARAHLTREGK